MKEQGGPPKRKSVFIKWKPVTLQELKMFCAVIIHMPVLHKPSVCDYWTKRPIMQTTYTMSGGFFSECLW